MISMSKKKLADALFCRKVVRLLQIVFPFLFETNQDYSKLIWHTSEAFQAFHKHFP